MTVLSRITREPLSLHPPTQQTQLSSSPLPTPLPRQTSGEHLSHTHLTNKPLSRPSFPQGRPPQGDSKFRPPRMHRLWCTQKTSSRLSTTPSSAYSWSRPPQAPPTSSRLWGNSLHSSRVPSCCTLRGVVFWRPSLSSIPVAQSPATPGYRN